LIFAFFSLTLCFFFFRSLKCRTLAAETITLVHGQTRVGPGAGGAGISCADQPVRYSDPSAPGRAQRSFHRSIPTTWARLRARSSVHSSSSTGPSCAPGSTERASSRRRTSMSAQSARRRASRSRAPHFAKRSSRLPSAKRLKTVLRVGGGRSQRTELRRRCGIQGQRQARRESSAAIPRELPRERRCLSTTTTTTTSMYLARQIRAASAIKRCESKRLSERRQVMGVELDSTVAGAAAAAAWRLPRRRVGPHSLCAPSAAATRSIARASTLG
jgi:hypothetical protein